MGSPPRRAETRPRRGVRAHAVWSPHMRTHAHAHAHVHVHVHVHMCMRMFRGDCSTTSRRTVPQRCVCGTCGRGVLVPSPACPRAGCARGRGTRGATVRTTFIFYFKFYLVCVVFDANNRRRQETPQDAAGLILSHAHRDKISRYLISRIVVRAIKYESRVRQNTLTDSAASATRLLGRRRRKKATHAFPPLELSRSSPRRPGRRRACLRHRHSTGARCRRRPPRRAACRPG